jgi:rhodanese-related sulfurtransferase
MATLTAFSSIPAGLRLGACTLLYGLALIGGTAHANAPVPEGPLVSTEWLAANLNRADVRIVEVSVNPGLYERAHVPGAVNFSWHNDLNDKVRRDIVGKEQFEKLLSQAGVKDGTTVVLYGDTNNWFAAWGAWVFDIYGVQNVKLLDGGRKKWEAENRPLNNRAPEYAATTYRVGKVNTALRARLTDALASAEGRSDAKLIDIRSADEIPGQGLRPGRRAGTGHPRRPHPRCRQRALGPGRARGRHVQTGRRAQEALCRRGHRRQQAGHHLLPHRRALQPHLVCAVQDPGLPGAQLRRLVDRIRQLRGCADQQPGRHGLGCEMIRQPIHLS